MAKQYVRGEHYLIPHLRYLQQDDRILISVAGYSRAEWIPILAPLHSDPELGVELNHFHYDRRFIPKFKLKLILPGHVVPVQRNRRRDGALVNVPFEIEYQYRKCVNPAMLSLGLDREDLLSRGLMDGIPINGDRLISGHLCPHKGVSTKGCPIIGGEIICPGHGLRFNAENGCLIAKGGTIDSQS